MLAHPTGDKIFVFLGFETARAVDESPIFLQQSRTGGEDVPLELGNLYDAFGIDAGRDPDAALRRTANALPLNGEAEVEPAPLVMPDGDARCEHSVDGSLMMA